MDKVLQFIKTRSIAYFIALAAVICGVVAFIVYLAAGTNSFVTSLSPSVIVPMAIGIVVGVAMLVRTYKLGLLAAYLAFFYGMVSVFIVNINLIANLAYNVDGSSFPVEFFVIVIFAALAMVGCLVAGIMTKYGQGGAKAVKEGRADL